jgi:hypothetical protein
VRCYFMRKGHIVGDVVLTVKSDEEAIEQSRSLFVGRMLKDELDGFAVWDRNRMLIQESKPAVPKSVF